jgi:hypothetical protein
MPKLLPDQSFYPSPTMAMQAPPETLAYVALLNPDPAGSDALAVLDDDPASPGYGAQIARIDMPGTGTSSTTLAGTRSSCPPASPHRRCSVSWSHGYALVANPFSTPARPAAAVS